MSNYSSRFKRPANQNSPEVKIKAVEEIAKIVIIHIGLSSDQQLIVPPSQAIYSYIGLL
jgi:hypothetical protein